MPAESSSATIQQQHTYRIDTLLVRAHSIAAFATLFIAVVFGILISLQFFLPDLVGNTPALSWGRLRYAHTQGIMLGWLGNAFLAFMYHAVPILSGRSVTSRTLGLWLFGIWNFAVMLPGWILVLAGVSQPLEWAEFPLIVDAAVLLALVLATVQFLPTFFHRGLENLYVSTWYIIGALVFTLLAYPMGNIVPEWVPGAAGAAFSGLWIHDAVGLFVTPLALAILYFVIPASTGRPIYSHFLSMLGFWGLFFLYPLNGTHHYIFSVIPMEAQVAAITASALLGVIVIIVVSNLMLSQRGAGLIPKDIGLRFVSMSVVFYLIVSVQGALQAQMSINQSVHFSDWVIGHSHLAMLGFATFAGIGGIVHAWQRLPNARYNEPVLNIAYWCLTIGVIVMVVDLTIAGIIQSHSWQSGSAWLESIRASQPYWLIRTLSAIPIAAGFVMLFAGLVSGPRNADQATTSTTTAINTASINTLSTNTQSPQPARALLMTYSVAIVAGVAFFFMSVSLLGMLPKQVLQAQTDAVAPLAPLPLTVAEQRGRQIYAREGCAYCHSQQIRYTKADIARFGAPTLAWESRFDYPHLMGTRRIGPDLSRSAFTRSQDWQFAHLYSPRAVVPLSIMPAYQHLFDGAADQPRQAARDLVAYLETLGRARELAWPEGDIAVRTALADNRWAQMSLNTPVLNAHPARTQSRNSTTVPDFNNLAQANTAEIDGMALWRDHCAGCHGSQGQGDGPAAASLKPRPTNLAERQYTTAALAVTLWHGVAGTAMPAWRDRQPAELVALMEVVRNFSKPMPSPAPSKQMLALGATVYQTHCAECHGDNGDGNGFAADQLPVAPTDFRGQRANLAEAQRVLRTGIAGTSMAPWTDRLDDDEIVAVAYYLRGFFIGDAVINNPNANSDGGPL